MDDAPAFPPTVAWIWAPRSAADAWWMFRRSLAFAPGCRGFRLRITAAFHYALWVNGRFVTRGPGTSFDFDKSFDEIDLGDYLVADGANAIAILAPSHTAGREGVLAALTWRDASGAPCTLCTDRAWRVERHRAYQPFTAGHAQGLSLLLGREEVFDAREEPVGWTETAFDDSAWAPARELGAAHRAPWTAFSPSGIALLTDDPVLPAAVPVIELAWPRTGHRVRLVCPKEHIDAVKVYATQVTCRSATMVRAYGSIGPCGGQAEVLIGGRPVGADGVQLAAGVHLLAVCHRGYYTYESEILLETEGDLSFSADALLPIAGHRWALRAFAAGAIEFPWHQTPETMPDPADLTALLRAPALAALDASAASGFAPAQDEAGSISFDVRHQRFQDVKGGFCPLRVATGQPRLPLHPVADHPVRDADRLLHEGAGGALISAVDGRDVHLVLDFAAEVVGFVELEVECPAGVVIDVQGFEMILPSGIAWMPHNGFRYTARAGRQRFTAQIRRGFRYLSLIVRGAGHAVRIHAVRCRRSVYPVAEIGSFACDDEGLNRAFRMSVATAAVCMLDTYVDCPGHEQTFWVGDARITAGINLVNFGAYGFNQRSIRLVGQSMSAAWAAEQRPGDARFAAGTFLPMAAFPNYPLGGLPMWPLLWVVQCWEHWLHGGDAAHLRENYGYVAEMMRRCRASTNERGLLDIPGAWNLIEWGANDLSPYGEVTANNVLLVQALRCAAGMATALGLHDEERGHAADAEERVLAINRLCWDEERGAYVDTVRDAWAHGAYLELCGRMGWDALPWERYRACSRISEQTNTLALLSRCVPADRAERVRRIAERVVAGRFVPGSPAARAVRPPNEHEAPDGIVAIGSPFFLFFSLAALFQEGKGALAIDVIRREWGRMGELDLRTCPEGFGWPRSAAHAWSASPAIFLPTEVLGIHPLEPGFRTFAVTPCPGGLRWARGSVATPNGPIHVEWSRNAQGQLDIRCQAPAGCRRVLDGGR